MPINTFLLCRDYLALLCEKQMDYATSYKNNVSDKQLSPAEVVSCRSCSPWLHNGVRVLPGQGFRAQPNIHSEAIGPDGSLCQLYTTNCWFWCMIYLHFFFSSPPLILIE